jgi:F0F1-type ATP synthase alpha subunit
VGLSVTRVGGVGQKKRQQNLRAGLLKKLASYRQAEEFSHFGSELAIESKQDLELGKKIYEAFKQPPDVVYTINEQDLILGTVMKSEGKVMINVDQIKRKAKEMAATIDPEADWDPIIADLLGQTTVQAPEAPAPAPALATTPAAPATAEAKK